MNNKLYNARVRVVQFMMRAMRLQLDFELLVDDSRDELAEITAEIYPEFDADPRIDAIVMAWAARTLDDATLYDIVREA